MSKKIIILTVILFGIIIAAGMAVFYGAFDDTLESSELTEDKVLQNHDTFFEDSVHQTPPEQYTEIVRVHEEQSTRIDSYEFTFERQATIGNENSLMFQRDTDVAMRTQTLPTETQNNIILTEYYDPPNRFVEQYNEESDETEYIRSTGVGSSELNQSGQAQLLVLETQYYEFVHQETVEHQDIQYYIYQPTEIDNLLENYTINENESIENVSIDGSLVVSEYGIVTYNSIELQSEEDTISWTYNYTNAGSTTIEEPLWVSQDFDTDEE